MGDDKVWWKERLNEVFGNGIAKGALSRKGAGVGRTRTSHAIWCVIRAAALSTSFALDFLCEGQVETYPLCSA
jgi:hypothetical protein